MKQLTTAFALCGFMAAVAPARADGEDCQLKRITTIDMEPTFSGPVIPVSLEGAPARLRFMLQDGFNTLNQAVVQARGLDDRYRFALIPMRLAKAKSFGFGQLAAQPEQFVELPASSTLPDVDGEFGTLPLSNADFEVDLARNKLNMFRSDHCPGKAVYWTAPANVAQLPIQKDFAGGFMTNMELDGKSVHVVFRTDGPSYIQASVAKFVFGLDETSPGMTEVTGAEARLQPANTDSKIYSYSFKTLSVGGLQINNPKFMVIPDTIQTNGLGRACLKGTVGVKCPPKPDVAVGLPVLSRLRLYFSTREQMLYLTAADAK